MMNKFIVGFIGIVLLIGIGTCFYDDVVFKTEKINKDYVFNMDIKNDIATYQFIIDKQIYKNMINMSNSGSKVYDLAINKSLSDRVIDKKDRVIDKKDQIKEIEHFSFCGKDIIKNNETTIDIEIRITGNTIRK